MSFESGSSIIDDPHLQGEVQTAADVGQLNQLKSDTRTEILQSVSMDYDERPVPFSSLEKPFEAVKSKLPDLIRQRDVWRDVVVDGVPVMNRLYLDIGDGMRVFLHRLDPSSRENLPVLHYHQWPSIVHVHKGGYRQQFAFGPPSVKAPPICASMNVVPGTQYEMVHPHLWHSVILGKSSWSTMLMKYNNPGFENNAIPVTDFTLSLKYPSLSAQDRKEMFEQFEQFYPLQ